MNLEDLQFMLNFHDKNMNVKLELVNEENQKFFAKLVQVYDDGDEIILSGDIE